MNVDPKAEGAVALTEPRGGCACWAGNIGAVALSEMGGGTAHCGTAKVAGRPLGTVVLVGAAAASFCAEISASTALRRLESVSFTS